MLNSTSPWSGTYVCASEWRSAQTIHSPPTLLPNGSELVELRSHNFHLTWSMSPWPKSLRTTRILMFVFFCSTVLLAAALVPRSVLVPGLPLTPVHFETSTHDVLHSRRTPASSVTVQCHLELPAHGEIFPALAASEASEYWPIAVLTIVNHSDRPILQEITAEIPGWTRRTSRTLIVGANQTRALKLNPELLPSAFANQEILRGLLHVAVTDATGARVFSQDAPIMLHSASDLYWGTRFANLRFLSRWVTPHDPAVLKLVSSARAYVPNGRLPGYNTPRGTMPLAAMTEQVRMQARAVFEVLRHSGLSYVSSTYTFGNFTQETERIRLPRETLTTNMANCIDTSVAFASAMENMEMDPVIVILPGHAFAGVRLGPQSQDVLYLDLTVLPHGTFREALERANKWMKKAGPADVLTVDVAAARMLNIYPMPNLVPEQMPPSTNGPRR